MTDECGNNFIKLSSSDLATKQFIRQKIWQYLEDNNLADFPRPVYNRIPNFKGSSEACNRAWQLSFFSKAQTFKVNPDKPQEQIRALALEANKILLVPTPRLRSGLFNRIIVPAGASKSILRKCATRQGITNFSKPVNLSEDIHVDVVVIGSVAVDCKGHRIGKGEGYADMEYAMMAARGCVTADTVVVSTVHDCQLFPELPDQLFGAHDVPVDYIVTPTQVVQCESQLPRPTGIIWSLLTFAKLKEIPVLKMLYLAEKNRPQLKEES